MTKRKKSDVTTAASLGYEKSDCTIIIFANKDCPFKKSMHSITGMDIGYMMFIVRKRDTSTQIITLMIV